MRAEKKRLVLEKETVKRLADQDLRAIQGEACFFTYAPCRQETIPFWFC